MIDTNKIIDDYLNDAWWVKENSNIPKSNMGLNNAISRAACKHYWLTTIYPEEIRETYKDGLFHIHNLGQLAGYCAGWSLEDLLLRGFGGGPGRQRSSPAKRLGTALGQLCNDFYTNQGEYDGAQAYNNIDTMMAPFIHYEGLSQEQVDQEVQEFIYIMGVPTRIGGQPPFTNVTLDITPPDFLASEYVIHGGKRTGDVYGDFADEMKMFNNAWWKQKLKGDADGSPQPWPIETLNVGPDFDWNDEILFRAVASRGSPYFSNFVTTGRKKSEVRSMCCRLELPLGTLAERNGGYFGVGDKTGSIGVMTMNLPLMAYRSKNKEEFFELLGKTLGIAKDALELKRVALDKWIHQYIFTMRNLQETFDKFGSYWKNHFSTIGLVGGHEACLNLLGEGIQTPEGAKFAEEILLFIRERLLEFQTETGNLYNGEATPAEGSSHDLADKDVRRYPKILHSGNGEGVYYTNSTQLPYWFAGTVNEWITHQEPLQKLYTGGTVQHFYGNETCPHWEGISKFMKRIVNHSTLRYTTYTPNQSICPNHGKMAGIHWVCPSCGSECDVWTRVTGYFSPVKQWHVGKQQEFRERFHFSIPSLAEARSSAEWRI